jgi:hypothetical protein
MEIQILKMGTKGDKHKGYYIRLSTREAISLIKSLSSQIVARNPNVDREESFTDKGEYFTIAVIPEQENQVANKISNRLRKYSEKYHCES